MAVTMLNIHNELYGQITKIALQHNKPRREIIVRLLMRVMGDHLKLMGGISAVKYQPDDDEQNWHPFHIALKPDEYEFFIDLRKVCKCSVSLLLAIAVRRYGHELTKSNEKIIDNYPYFQNYVLRRNVVDGIYCWHFYWGLPKTHLCSLKL